MKHVAEDDLILHYYGELEGSADIERHLRVCRECGSALDRITATLNRITAPDAPEPNDVMWSDIREQVLRSAPVSQGRPLLGVLVWLVPLLYPFSAAAIFRSAQLADAHMAVGTPVLFLALAWALGGPFVALSVLNRLRAPQITSMHRRLIVYGALAATVSPALFNLTSGTGLGLLAWYAVSAAIAMLALVPIGESAASTERLRKIHRRSALMIVVFAAAHLSNHLFAIVSVSSHSNVIDVLRLVYRQPVIEALLMTAIAVQLGTGGALIWQAHLRRPSMTLNVQALSGMYLGVFFLAHVTAVLMARGQTDTNFVWAAGREGLLANPGSTFLLPYYLLGVVALFAHVGAYVRPRIRHFIPAVSPQRFSYAVAACCAMVVFTLGLALCGVHLVPDVVVAMAHAVGRVF